MLPSWRQIDVSSLNQFTINGLMYIERADTIKTLGKGPGKPDGHVLHDKNGDRKIARQIREQILQGLRAARRRANRNDRRHDSRGASRPLSRTTFHHSGLNRSFLDQSLLHRSRQTRSAGASRMTSRSSALQRTFDSMRGSMRRRKLNHRRARRSRSLDLADQFGLNFKYVVRPITEALSDAVECAQRKRFNRRLRSTSRQRTNNNDWPRPVGHDALQDLKPIHPRHIDIERNHVGLQRIDLR